MLHFTIFGASKVNLHGGGQFILTLFGGTEVRKQTLAKRLLQQKHLLNSSQSPANADQVRNVDKVLSFLQGNYPAGRRGAEKRRTAFLLTIFGVVEIKPPTIAEEFMDMRELVSSGLISNAEWDQLVGQLYQVDELDSISSFTLFAGMGEERLDDEEELKKIHSAGELGLISKDEEIALRSVVGRDSQQVRMLLRQTAFC